jgi:hypothetical protein
MREIVDLRLSQAVIPAAAGERRCSGSACRLRARVRQGKDEYADMDEKVPVFRPTGAARKARDAAGRPERVVRPLSGLKVALVDNGKPNAINLLLGMADALGVAEEQRIVTPAKDYPSRPLNPVERGMVEGHADVAVMALGDCGACTSWTCLDAVAATTEMGIPTVLVVSEPFVEIGRNVAAGLGYPKLPIVTVPHPIGELPAAVALELGTGLAGPVREALLEGGAAASGLGRAVTADAESDVGEEELVWIDGDQGAVDAFFDENDWSDGLPVVAPTEARVAAMLGRHAARADEVIGRVATGYGIATYRSVAVNAVLAGCLPEYFDVVVAAVRAAIAPPVNLHAIQATTHPVGAMIMVNGPVVDRIGLNARTNCFGPGNRANATIGRALNLVLQNVGRSVGGVTDRATFGQPGKYTFCFAENEAESPWEPFHVSRGFSAADSTVTVFGSEGPHNVNDHGSISAEALLKTFVGSVTTTGSNHHQFPNSEPLVVMSPEHAHIIARGGYDKAAVQEFLFTEARPPLSAFAQERIDRWLSTRKPQWFGPQNTTGSAALCDRPEDFLVAVAGGPGTQSMFIPSFGGTRCVTIAVEE